MICEMCSESISAGMCHMRNGLGECVEVVDDREAARLCDELLRDVARASVQP